MAASRYSPDPYPGHDISSPQRLVHSAIPNRYRLALFGASCGVFGMLALARWLEPSAAGYGTHQQLGFPPCTFVRLFGQICPTCGMTTAWALVVRGRLLAAVVVNAGGTLLALTAIVAVPWGLVSALRGRWWLIKPKEKTICIFFVVFVLITIFDWMRRIYFA